MSVISTKLKEIGYLPLVDADHFAPDTLVSLPEMLGLRVPDDYMEFLAEFPNTGILGTDVLCKGITPSPWAPDGHYAVSLLYAACSNASYDLVKINIDRNDSWDFPVDLLAIGDDVGGNVFCLDLRNETFGQIYFWDHEHVEGESGLHLVSENFTSFVTRLQKG